MYTHTSKTTKSQCFPLLLWTEVQSVHTPVRTQAYGPALSQSNFSILSVFCLVYNNVIYDKIWFFFQIRQKLIDYHFIFSCQNTAQSSVQYAISNIKILCDLSCLKAGLKPCLDVVVMVVSTVAHMFLTLFQAVLIYVNTLITISQA